MIMGCQGVHRGLWRCQKNKQPFESRYKQGREGCGRWNAHMGKTNSKRVDTRCQYCNRRVAFTPRRKGGKWGRGRPRSIVYVHFPDDTPLEALIEARDGLNSALPTPTGPLVVDLDDEGLPTGFRKARELK